MDVKNVLTDAAAMFIHGKGRKGTGREGKGGGGKRNLIEGCVLLLHPFLSLPRETCSVHSFYF